MMNLKDIEDKFNLPTYRKLDLIIEKGEGSYVWNENGDKYLDLYGGHAVAILGHSNKKIIQAITDQANKLMFYSNVVYNSTRAYAAKKIIEFADNFYSNVFFCNTGSESNENALKLAQNYNNKTDIIAFKGCFHGRSIGALSTTGIDNYRSTAKVLLNNVKFGEFGNIESVENLISDNTSCVFIEPIQSMSGVNEADPLFYKKLRKLCDDNDIILIFDEVQTGLGRSGKKFYGDHHDIKPDMITLAKGLGNGFPIGAVLVNENISKSVNYGDQGTTFGGSPMASAAAIATLDIIQEDALIKRVGILHDILKSELQNINFIKKIKGKGLLLGLDLDIKSKTLQKKMLEKNIIIGGSVNPNISRLLPPYTISNDELSIFVEALRSMNI